MLQSLLGWALSPSSGPDIFGRSHSVGSAWLPRLPGDPFGEFMDLGGRPKDCVVAWLVLSPEQSLFLQEVPLDGLILLVLVSGGPNLVGLCIGGRP